MKPLLSPRSVIFLLIFSSLVFIILGCGNGEIKPSAKTGPPAIPVEAMVIQPRLLENKIYTTGTLLANEEVELHPEISGRIVGVHFDEGKQIKKGELMVKINDAELQADLKAKEPEAKQAADEERRKRGLFDVKAISQEEYDKSLSTSKMIEAERLAIESQLRETEIRAPFDGVVGLRYVSEGDYASPSLLVATIQDIDPVKAEFSVPEKYAHQLKEGIKVVVRIGDSQTEHIGTVYAVEAKIDPGTRTIKARARVPNPDGTIIPGSFAKIELTLEQMPNAIVVPAGAIIPEMTGVKVYVSVDGKAKAVPVKTGIRTDRDVQIVEGLNVNDTLIVTGMLQLGEGKGVTITGFKTE
jgi:membrane fusion protein (multidrug efflux system)